MEPEKLQHEVCFGPDHDDGVDRSSLNGRPLTQHRMRTLGASHGSQLRFVGDIANPMKLITHVLRGSTVQLFAWHAAGKAMAEQPSTHGKTRHAPSTPKTCHKHVPHPPFVNAGQQEFSTENHGIELAKKSENMRDKACGSSALKTWDTC